MGIRFPLKTVLDVQNNGLIGAASAAGGIANTFVIPQDADAIVVKLQSSTAGGGVSATLQTSDDGGTTWYDVSRTSVVSNVNGTTAAWCAGFVNAGGIATAQNNFPTNSIMAIGIRNTAASVLAQNQISGLPMLGPLGRVFHIIDAGVTGVVSVRTQVKVNSEAAGQ
jgi:hypothetical protein